MPLILNVPLPGPFNYVRAVGGTGLLAALVVGSVLLNVWFYIPLVPAVFIAAALYLAPGVIRWAGRRAELNSPDTAGRHRR